MWHQESKLQRYYCKRTFLFTSMFLKRLHIFQKNIKLLRKRAKSYEAWGNRMKLKSREAHIYLSVKACRQSKMVSVFSGLSCSIVSCCMWPSRSVLQDSVRELIQMDRQSPGLRCTLESREIGQP